MCDLEKDLLKTQRICKEPSFGDGPVLYPDNAFDSRL